MTSKPLCRTAHAGKNTARDLISLFGAELMAEELGVSRQTIYDWRKKGFFPPEYFVKTGQLVGRKKSCLEHLREHFDSVTDEQFRPLWTVALVTEVIERKVLAFALGVPNLTRAQAAWERKGLPDKFRTVVLEIIDDQLRRLDEWSILFCLPPEVRKLLFQQS